MLARARKAEDLSRLRDRSVVHTPSQGFHGHRWDEIAPLAPNVRQSLRRNGDQPPYSPHECRTHLSASRKECDCPRIKKKPCVMPPASRRRRNPLGKQHKMGRRPLQKRVPDRIAQNEWFYENGGQRHGPVSPPQRKTLATKGTVTPATLVWKEGLPQWTPAKAIRGLFPEEAAEAPAATPVNPPPPPRFDQPSQSLLSLLCDLRHPLDIVVDRLRYVIPQDITANISRVAATAGVLCIYLAVGAFSAVVALQPQTIGVVISLLLA